MSSFDPIPADEELNPYAPPLADLGPTPTGQDGDHSEAEAVRRRYLGHEVAVKSIGSLHYLGAFFGMFGIVGMLAVFSVLSRRDASVWPLALATVAVYTVMTGVNLALGYGLRRLQTWARWTETAFLLIGILVTLLLLIGSLFAESIEIIIPYSVGVLIYAYVLYLLVSSKGTMVFSPGYQAVIAQTPHVKYKTSWIVKLAVTIFFVIFGLAIILAVIGAIVTGLKH